MTRKRLNKSPLNGVQWCVLIDVRDGKGATLTGTYKASATSMVKRGWITADRSALTRDGIAALSNLQAWMARHGKDVPGID
jgi:hypothetical protein